MAAVMGTLFLKVDEVVYYSYGESSLCTRSMLYVFVNASIVADSGVTGAGELRK
jgi:hypothetical protein